MRQAEEDFWPQICSHEMFISDCLLGRTRRRVKLKRSICYIVHRLKLMFDQVVGCFLHFDLKFRNCARFTEEMKKWIFRGIM